MKTRQLGNSDLQITAIGYGAWAIGGAGWEAAWGAQDDGEAIAAIQAAIDAGINWIDTAAVYGLGHSEVLVAKALKGRGKRPYIFTKSSKLWDKDHNVISSMKSIRKADGCLDGRRIRLLKFGAKTLDRRTLCASAGQASLHFES